MQKKVDKMRFVNWKFSNERKSFENDDWKASIIAEKKNRKFHLFRIKYDHWLISKFSTIFQNSRIISKQIKKMFVSDKMQIKEKFFYSFVFIIERLLLFEIFLKLIK